jgi:ketosteroid isomerase-like protein
MCLGEITMTTGPTPALMKQINEAFNSRDVDRIMSFFAEDCTFLMARGPEPEGRRVHGKAAVSKVLGDRFRVCDLYEFRGDKVLNKDTYWKLVEHRDRL